MEDQHELPRAQRPRTYDPLSGLCDMEDDPLTPQELFKKLTGREASQGLGRWEMYELLIKAGAGKDDLLTVYSKSQMASANYWLKKKTGGVSARPARGQTVAPESVTNKPPEPAASELAPDAPGKPAEPVTNTAPGRPTLRGTCPSWTLKEVPLKKVSLPELPDILDDLEACAALLREVMTRSDLSYLRIIARSLARDVQELKEALL
jgi:hypothetical protein